VPIETHEITNRDEWLAWRKRDVTASDIGALFGLSPWKGRTLLQLWAEKTGRAQPQIDTPALRRGRWLEPAVLTALAEAYPYARIERCSFYVRDPLFRLGATPDALLDGRLVELKTVARPIFEGWGEEPPLAYKLQATVGAMLTGGYPAMVACLVLDTYSADLQVFHVEQSEEAEERIREGVVKFWTDVEAGVMPPADYGEDGELLAQLFKPRAEAEPVDLTGDNLLPGLLIERESLKAEIKARKDRVEAIKAELIDKLQGAPVGICEGWTIRNKAYQVAERIQKAYSYTTLTITRKREAA
jgi:putative phage-type endonuclease